MYKDNKKAKISNPKKSGAKFTNKIPKTNTKSKFNKKITSNVIDKASFVRKSMNLSLNDDNNLHSDKLVFLHL